MVIQIPNGNPVIAMVLMSLSTFKTSALIASFQSILLSFGSEEAAKKFVEEAKSLGCSYSRLESTNVTVFPDFGSSIYGARVVYRAVDAYKDSLISVNEFEMSPIFEEEDKLLKNIEQYLKKYFGSDAVTTATLTQ